MNDHNEKIISIESQILLGDTKPTYFVDLVTTDTDGHKSRGNLRAVTNLTLARSIARQIANAIPCMVDDETMKEENMVRNSRFANDENQKLA